MKCGIWRCWEVLICSGGKDGGSGGFRHDIC